MDKALRLAILSTFFVITLVGVFAASFTLKNNLETRSRAEDISPTATVPDCAKDPNDLEYCGNDRPFRGCNGGGEWLCQCRRPNGHWWSECSVVEDTETKVKYKAACGGDEAKAFSQWKYDIAIAETGGQCSCGGENVCGSLIPTRGAGGGGGGGNIPPWETPPPIPTVAIPTLIPSPTLVYSVPTQSEVAPTTIIYYLPPTLPPYNPPTNIPYVPPTTVIQPTSTPKPVAKPIINIDVKKNVEGIKNFIANTQKSLVDFFSKVLP